MPSDPSRTPADGFILSFFYFLLWRLRVPFQFASVYPLFTIRCKNPTVPRCDERFPLRKSVTRWGGRGSEKEKISVTRQWCWRSSNKSAITTELWRDWLEQVVTNKPTHKPLVILEPNKQIRPDASKKKNGKKAVNLHVHGRICTRSSCATAVVLQRIIFSPMVTDFWRTINHNYL